MPKGPPTPADSDREDPAEDEDLRDDGEADEDEDAEEERRERARRARRKRRAAERAGGRAGADEDRPRRRQRESAPPATEAALDSPNRKTIGMLSVVVAATLGMWVGAQQRCNLHPAETRKPREIAAADLAREPKSAALELQQRWSGYDFARAKEFARGDALAQLQRDEAACTGDTCARRQAELAEETLARATLLTRSASQAVVRVEALGGLNAPGTYLVSLEIEGARWVASGHAKDLGAPVPSLGGEAPTPGSASPAQSGSAAVQGSASVPSASSAPAAAAPKVQGTARAPTSAPAQPPAPAGSP